MDNANHVKATFPVNILDIVPGKQIIVEPASRNHGQPFTYLEGTVEKVGRKFFYVRCKNYSYLLKFALADGLCTTDYGIEYYAYPSLDVFRKQKERIIMARAISDRLSRNDIPGYGTIQAIYELLELPPLGEIIKKKE